MKKIIALTLTLAFGSISMADQCAYISKDKAEKAVVALMQTQSIQSLCEPCGETKAVEVNAKSVGLRKTEVQNFYEVVVNGEGIDLAYTYVNGLNLSKLVGCSSKSVSSSIK